METSQMESLSLIGRLAAMIGASEPALRLLVSILLGYPIAFIYRKYIYQRPKIINHLFIAVTGIIVCFFNYGTDVYHSMLAVIVTWLFSQVLSGPTLVGVSFVFHMTYLLAGYYLTGTDEYDIKWTMPHCVLVLRLIGLSFDLSDGTMPDDKLSIENRKSCLRRTPNILEMYSYTFFPGSFMVGPQFPFRRYDSFMNKEYDQHTGYVAAGLRRGAFGLLYLAMHQVGGAIYSDAYMLSDEYALQPFWYRLIVLGIWGKCTLYKYISCWLLSEGVATCFGLTFTADSKDGQWSSLANIRLSVFENAMRFQHYVDSFNVNTNHWVAQYIYKRLKFLGNRYLSHLAALMFLAVWHGFHTGYYMCFIMEFIVMNCEREVINVLKQSDKIMAVVKHPVVQPVLYLILKVYIIIGMGWCLIPFVHLSFDRWQRVYASVYYYGFLYLPWPLYRHVLKLILGLNDKDKAKTDDQTKSTSVKEHSN